MGEGLGEAVFLLLSALFILGFGLLVGFFGVVMVIHGEGFGLFLLLVSVSCFAGALRILACLLPDRT